MRDGQRRGSSNRFQREPWEECSVVSEDMEDGAGGGFNELFQCLIKTVWMVHPIDIVHLKSDFEGGRWNRPHDIPGLNPWDEQVVGVDRYGRLCTPEGDQQKGTRDLTTG